MATKVEEKKINEAIRLLEENNYTITKPNFYRCMISGKDLSLKQNNFYLTNNYLYKGCTTKDEDGKEINVLPFSKKEIEKLYNEFLLKTNDEKLALYKLTQELRIPWNETLWEAAKASGTKNYMFFIGKQNSLPQYKDTTMEDSDDYIGNTDDKVEQIKKVSKKEARSKEQRLSDLVDFFGEGYNTEMYFEFEKKYNLLKDNYDEKTGMHTEALLKYIKYSVLEEKSMIEGDVKAAKEWGTLSKNAATAAKINPSQLSKADLMDGLNSFSELSAAVEKAVDVVRILPQFKFRPSDALDFTLWCYINYERNLNGLPDVEYSDVYKFYDEKVADYIAQYGDPTGIFTGDTTVNNRDTIKEFIKPFKEDEI